MEKAAAVNDHACHAGLFVSFPDCTFDKHDPVYFRFIITPGDKRSVFDIHQVPFAVGNELVVFFAIDLRFMERRQINLAAYHNY